MPIGVGAVIGIGASIVGGVLGASSAKKAAQAAAREKARLQNKLSNLEKNRQDVVNPYEDFTNLSGMITNPFANLGVATGAATGAATTGAATDAATDFAFATGLLVLAFWTGLDLVALALLGIYTLSRYNFLSVLTHNIL